MAGKAMLAWLLIAVPAVVLMTVMLTIVLRHVPAVAQAETGE
jgi:flagellar basal body-associated protein FliL